MKKAASVQYVCQTKGCVKAGKPQHIAKWNYFICDEHNHLLTYDDKLYIARTGERSVVRSKSLGSPPGGPTKIASSIYSRPSQRPPSSNSARV
jgi:hypothetical protein